MGFTIPEPLKAEHDHLHDDLKAAIAKGNRTGEAAREVARLLAPHFVSEEEFALPPLGLLTLLAQPFGKDEISREDAKAAIAMADRLSSELPRMFAEHKGIVAALGSLIAAAQMEHHSDIVAFAEKLMLHARTEEEVLYPAAVIVGRYLKLRAKIEPEPVWTAAS